MTSPPPTLIFGGASVGSTYTTPDALADLLTALKAQDIHRIDTAARYPSANPGESERLLGATAAARQGFTIDTKILILSEAAGSLAPAAVEKSLRESYERLDLGTDTAINVLYCHAPDPTTPLEEQAAGLDAQYKKGLFKQLGVSNFPPEMLERFFEICERKGFVKPTVYQGQYNLVSRASEATLFPILRRHGIVFNAYSPLGGGFLTGKFTSGDTEGTRFAEGSPFAPMLRAQFDKTVMHDAVRALDESLATYAPGVSKVEVSLRWVCFHSALGSGDGVILGASSPAQLVQNVVGIRNGPLPEEVVAAVDAIWHTVSGS
ncbi:NADP-dependent oxidoreductase domain-containing protein [Mycena galericulata]|nr:NADP-dependent oxidoreductase domain-containing protein [Mycena galericulata]